MNVLVRIILGAACVFTTFAHAGLETQWTRRFTGNTSVSYSVRVTQFDAARNVIVAGVITEPNTQGDLWVAKLNGITGEVMWEFRRNGTLNFSDTFGGIAIAPGGDVFVAGALINELSPTGAPAVDSFLARLDFATGVPVWATPPASGPQAQGIWSAVALAGDGNPVVTGLMPDAQQSATDMRTAKFNAADGANLWDKPYASFVGNMNDVGERLYIDSAGEIFVQGRHDAGTVAGVNYQQTAVVARYGPDGTLRWGARVREAQTLNAFTFLPGGPDAFVIGVTTGNLSTGFTSHTFIRGSVVDGAVLTGRLVPLVSIAPLVSVAANGDILFAGRGVGGNFPPPLVAGRVSPIDFAEIWAKPLDTGTPGTGTGFGHAELSTGETVVAGIVPRPSGDDLSVGSYDGAGLVTEQLYFDGGAPGPAIPDYLPSGSTLDTDDLGGLAVSIRSESAGSTNDVLVRRMRQAGVPQPVVTTGAAERTGPSSGLFHGTVENLPFGGTAMFEYRLAGPGDPVGPPLTTSPVVLLPSLGPQSVSTPFTLQPHRTYGYKLVVRATDGTQTATEAGVEQLFAVPNAPVVSQRDVFFVARGSIIGQPLANDFDGDPGEALTITIDPVPDLPGVLTLKSGELAFKPTRSFTGELLLQYTVDDGNGATSTHQIVLRNGLHYAGSYRALAPVDGAHVGAVDVTVSPAGRATGAVYLDGERYSISGVLEQIYEDTVGFSVTIGRRNQPDRTLQLSWTPDRALTAELFEGEETLYTAHGLRAAPSPFPTTNVYNLLATHTNLSGNAGGRVTGCAFLKLPLDGRTTFRGRLGDGTPFVTKAKIQEDGKLPIYTALQGRPDSYLVGLLQPNENDVVTVAPGFLVVQGEAKGSTPAYAADYRDLVNFSGPRFTPASKFAPPLTFTSDVRRLELQSTGGGYGPSSFTLPIWMGGKGQLSGIIGITRIAVDGQTGEFSGAFLPEGQTRTVPFSGILRQNLNNGIAVFRGAPEAGQIQIVPQ